MKNRDELIIFLLIIAIASFFRLYHIQSVPPGLYPDEAMNGNNAIQALESNHFKIFYPENNGREGLFIDLEAISIKFFGNTSWALRTVSAITGIFTVIGLYLLAKQLFNSHIAGISSFLLAVSFWHVLFSRIGFRAIMAPLFIVWGFYFLWRGLRSSSVWDFILSGLCWGLGFYTYIAFRIIPLALFLVLIAYWQTIKKDFTHSQYIHARIKLLKGIAALGITALIITLPILWYFYNNPQDFLGRTSQLSVFSSNTPLEDLGKNMVKTLGMFVISGDWNWRHNYAGEPELAWPVAALFAIGLLGSILKLRKSWRKHGHISAPQVLLLSWFFIGLIPVVISNGGIPHALRSVLVAPVAMLFAAQGLWWIFQFIDHRYRMQDVHEINVSMPLHHRLYLKESTLVSTTVIIIFLAAIGFAEFDKYFNRWATNPNVADAFSKRYSDIAQQINALPPSRYKYVVVNAEGILVNGIPMPAQTVMYLTDTWTPAKQKAKNIYYLTEEQYKYRQYRQNGIVFSLEPRK